MVIECRGNSAAEDDGGRSAVEGKKLPPPQFAGRLADPGAYDLIEPLRAKFRGEALK